MPTALLSLLLVVVAARPSDACVQLQEANKLLGWSADGTMSLHARIDDGKLTHAEILPTRYEGWKYVIAPEGRSIAIHKIAVTSCAVLHDAKVAARVKGVLTEASLRALPLVVALKLVPVPSDDGGASKLTARFVPDKRYAEHQLEVRDAANKLVTTLAVPVWCVGSCHRDEAWRRWGATITTVATAGDRTLYAVRMNRVCNGGNDKDMWIDRVIATSGTEKRPPRSRCRGSGQ